MWDLPWPGIECMSPALAGRLSTSEPLGKSPLPIFKLGCLLLLLNLCSCAPCIVRLEKPKGQSLEQRKVYWRVKQGVWEAFAQNTQGFLERVCLVWFGFGFGGGLTTLCGLWDLASLPPIKPGPSAGKARSPKHGTAKEFHRQEVSKGNIWGLGCRGPDFW